MNQKNYILYDLIIKSVIKIMTQDNIYQINIKSITSDDEFALLKAIKSNFKNVDNFICLYHFKKNLISQLKIEGMMKKNFKKDSKYIVNELTKLCIDYNGSINYIYEKINTFKTKYPKFSKFLENYFIKNKLKYFISGEMNYNLIPEDCRSNSYLENYNKLFKQSLGKNKRIHWINYIHFINIESTRIKNKLL